MTDIILVPLDLEQPSSRALEHAVALAAPMKAEVVLLHVYTLPSFSYPGLGPTLTAQLNQEIGAAARRAVDELAAEKGGIRVILREGDPATEILDVATELAPALVVMGTHGRKGLARVFLGSVAEKVVRRCPYPVLTVRGETDEASAAPAATPA